MINWLRVSCIGFIGATTLAVAIPAFAHDTELIALPDGAQIVNGDGTFGSGSSASGTFEIGIDEGTNVFDVVMHVDGILPADLDNSHGPNGSAIVIHLGDAVTNGPIILDLSWYVAQGFGTIVSDGDDGFDLEISGIIFDVQGALDVLTETGLDAAGIHEAMEEGEAYVEVHSLAHPEGDIRGAIFEPPNATEEQSWGGVKVRFIER